MSEQIHLKMQLQGRSCWDILYQDWSLHPKKESAKAKELGPTEPANVTLLASTFRLTHKGVFLSLALDGTFNACR